jgi:hypothetical protein
MAEPQISRQVGAHGVGIENYRIEQRSERRGERSLACTRQSDDKNLAH